ncbi:MAG TPA: ATP-dependent DNA helicase RecG [Ktedonobacterales bacterium]|nr:ATP-dependent DNA helicase RecG [Ktedonobacterales bacterium]
MLPPVIEKARKILLHEQRQGHTDQTVRPGGLEAFVARWTEEVEKLRLAGALTDATGAPPVEQTIQHLLQDYHTLDPMQRAARVRAALARLGGQAADTPPATALPAQSAARPTAAAPSARVLPTSDERRRTAAPQPAPTKDSLPLEAAPVPAIVPGDVSQEAAPWDVPARRPVSSPVIGSRHLIDLSNQFDESAFAAPSEAADEPEQGEQETDGGQMAVDSHFLLSAQVTAVPGVGSSQAAKLHRLGIHTVQDLLWFFPREHHDYSKLEKIATIPLEQVVTIMGMIWEVQNLRSAGGRVRTVARVSDETGQIRATWFNQPYLLKQLTRGSYIVLTGVKQRFGNKVEFNVRSHELPEQGDLVNTGRLVPIYTLTEGLNAKALRRYTKWAVDRCAELLPEYLPGTIRSRVGLPSLPQAISQYHFPENETKLVHARRRLAFDELFLIQLGMLARRAEWRSGAEGIALKVDLQQMFETVDTSEAALLAAKLSSVPTDAPPPDGSSTSINNASEQRAPLLPPASTEGSRLPANERPLGGGLWPVSIDTPFESALPFKFTRAQRRVITEILADLGRAQPMIRLLQGDVGSGKTVVAAAALLTAAANGLQGVLMAPTEILAEQHYRTVSRLLEPFGIRVALLVGSQRQRERATMLAAAESGEAMVVVGTHALIQEGVTFARLGFVVVDEQHRFGVEQRDALRQKGYNPHMLVMTATPIPRTLALTLYGDLDISTLDEMPQGRQPVITRWRSGTRRAEAYHVIAEQVAQSRQAYVICPLIEESETLEDVKAAVVEYERLRTQVFPTLRLGLVHGGLKASEKEQVMRRFRDGELDVLVATAVVEVGVDVPNATVMAIEDADRFGLSQLHQFRGRVGRGEHQSYCYVLSEGSGPQAQERLSVIERTTNGFTLAEEDLKLRGPGDFFGTRQSGLPELRVANLADTRLLEVARAQAEWLWSSDAYLQKHEHRLLRERVATFWSRFVGH